MNRIVRENNPVADLPEDLRGDLPPSGVVSVTLELVSHSAARDVTFEKLMTLRRPSWLMTEQVQAQIDELRGDRDL